jgi:hypothetical protein
MNPFSYPITRRSPSPIWGSLVITLVLIGLALGTVFNFVASGYEYVPKMSPDFNKTCLLWYQKWTPSKIKNYTPEAWDCTPSIIQINEGSLSVQK